MLGQPSLPDHARGTRIPHAITTARRRLRSRRPARYTLRADALNPSRGGRAGARAARPNGASAMAGSNSGTLAAERHSFFDRLVGFLRFDRDVYEEIERDPAAIWQALLVVAIASAAAALGIYIARPDSLAFLAAFAGEVAQWALFAALAYFVGISLFAPPRRASLWQVGRLIGFAQAPRVLGIFGFIHGFLGGLIPLVGTGIFLVYAIACIRAAFDYSPRRSIAITVFTFVVLAGILYLVELVLHLDVSILPTKTMANGGVI
jgi:Yip1 domain